MEELECVEECSTEHTAAEQVKMDLRDFSGKGHSRLHVANVRRYLSASKKDYIPPPIPVDIPSFPELANEHPPFGDYWKKYFHLSEEFTFLNHGALGCTLKNSLAVSQAYERYMDSQPVKVKDRELVPLLAHSLRNLADFVGCEAQDLFFTQNCTAGINTILQSLYFSTGDSILTLSIGYGAVGYAVDRVCKDTGAKHEKVKINLPIAESQQIVDAVEASLHSGIKLAIFDHIPSDIPLIMPIVELTKLCKARGILVLIDAAHSVGQLEINIPLYGADFYVSNCHKWFANTRGSAFGYVKRELQHHIRPLVVSWGFGQGFAAEFLWSGTAYYSQFVSLLATLNFWKAMDPQTIRDGCSATVKKAVRLCCEYWKVEPLYPYDLIGMVATVKLPVQLNDVTWKPEGVKKDLIADCLYFKHKIEVPIRDVDGELYIRISCHIYNQMSDYEKLCAAVLDICDNRDSLTNYNHNFEQIPI